MVFECAGCRVRYKVDDERLVGKTFRFTCQACGQVHVLRDPRTHTHPVEAIRDEPHPLSQKRAVTPTRHPTISEIRLTRSAPTVSQPSAKPKNTGAMPTRTVSARQTQETWFAIKRGQRIGPFKREDLLLLLRDGVLHEKSFLWRPTMSAWTRFSEISELSDILERFRQTQEVSGAESFEEVPPPLPQSAQQATSSEGTVPEHLDALYSKISRPVIDLRKVREVQPEEPEIADATPSQVVPSFQTQPSLGDSADFTSEERRFFARAFVLPEQAWPEAPAAKREKPVEPEQTAARPKEPVPSLRDFSVLMRLSRRTRKRMILVYGALGVVISATVALTLYWAFSKGPMEDFTVRREPGVEIQPFVQQLYTVPQKSSQEPSLSPKAKPSERTLRHERQGRVTPDRREPSSQTLSLEPLPEVDPALAAEFKKYASLLEGAETTRPEVTLDVKPRTLTEMPQWGMDDEGMNAFLATKVRQFADCKAQMTHKTDMPVKVVLQFTVGLDGRVKEATVEQASGITDKGLSKCILTIVKGWAFPPKDEEATVKTTLLF